MPALKPMVCPSPQEVLRSAASSSSCLASVSLVLERAALLIAAARRGGHARANRIELSARQALEDVALEQDLRTPVGEKAAAGGLDLGDRQDRVRIDAEKLRRVVDRLCGERQTSAYKLDGHQALSRRVTQRIIGYEIDRGPHL
jgi:hypothetical protein